MLITLEQIFVLFLNKYPSLYASNSIKLSKLRVYDHIFNTIGNGIRTIDDLYSYLSLEDLDSLIIQEKYVSDIELYRCYFSHDYKFQQIYLILTEEEANNNSLIVDKLKLKKINYFKPYRNFKKEYSIVWTPEVDLFDLDSLKEILWFYKECELYFYSENKYDNFLSGKLDSDKFNSSLKEQEKYLEKYFDNTHSKEEAYQQISKAYGVPFNGDMRQFVLDRAELDIQQSLSFIKETIEMLEYKIKNY